jgi:hypothetical protein
MDLTTKEGVVQLMGMSQTSAEWNQNCDKVKAANQGLYPAFWFETIIQSGLCAQVSARWGGDDKIHIAPTRG